MGQKSDPSHGVVQVPLPQRTVSPVANITIIAVRDIGENRSGVSIHLYLTHPSQCLRKRNVAKIRLEVIGKKNE